MRPRGPVAVSLALLGCGAALACGLGPDNSGDFKQIAKDFLADLPDTVVEWATPPPLTASDLESECFLEADSEFRILSQSRCLVCILEAPDWLTFYRGAKLLTKTGPVRYALDPDHEGAKDCAEGEPATLYPDCAGETRCESEGHLGATKGGGFASLICDAVAPTICVVRLEESGED